MLFPTLAAVAAVLTGLVSGHISMKFPDSVYTHHDGTDLNPLNPDGSNYPCFYADGGSGTFPTIQLGTESHIGLQGSAVHGGGSCQISITYDVPPNKKSVFKVVKSFQGSCPIHVDGNLAPNATNTLPELDYVIPANIPTGKAVIAWTWFNKIGNREMYMRCAPVLLTGGSGDSIGYNLLPDIFKANIGNGCSTTEGVDTIFPNPGSVVEGSGTGPPVGICGCSGSGSTASSLALSQTSTNQQPTTTQVEAPVDTPVQSLNTSLPVSCCSLMCSICIP